MRILGIDYGDARIGISLSDETGFLASPVESYKSVTMRQDISYVASLAAKYSCGEIVVGLPLNMNGTEGPRAGKTRAFGNNLAKESGLNVVFVDERLTTVQAERGFETTGVKKSKRKGIVDAAAAVIILQTYLDKKRSIL